MRKPDDIDAQIDFVARALTARATTIDLQARVLRRLPDRAPRPLAFTRPVLALVACAIVAVMSWRVIRTTHAPLDTAPMPAESPAGPTTLANGTGVVPAPLATSRPIVGRARVEDRQAFEPPLPPLELAPLTARTIQPDALAVPLLHVGAIATPAITLAPIDADRPNRF